ncbi:FKBP-type peptidyl-prolyl cis-trans isomerase [Actinomyces slackii]|uniref:peptidylprolyl isomerase n=1 Tax=Actinomyces slackii TaxID=52774 RepID=A0A448KDN4_9ACTO|nr:FKBP-type peptidyl-prolyl cis-trans isomerase [Actinomyces slackii]VEG75039.1 FK506-binding protein [Actinomyces slackii]
MRRTHLTLTTMALAACLTLAACGQSGGGAQSTAAAQASTQATAQPAPGPVDCSTVTVDSDSDALPVIKGEAGAEPAVSWTGKEPPANLTVKTLDQGSGQELKETDTVIAHYVGWQWDTNEAFDSSWSRGGSPAAFSLQQVVSGWTCGLTGAHVGDRVLMSIPADLAYGDDPAGGRPTGTLVFVVEIKGGGSSDEIAAGTKDAVMEGEAAVQAKGVTVGGELGAAATVSVNEGAAEPTAPEVIVLARGTGEPIKAGDTILAHTASMSWDNSTPNSTWENQSPQSIPVTDQKPMSDLVGVPAGSRVVVLTPADAASGAPASAHVVDIEQIL